VRVGSIVGFRVNVGRLVTRERSASSRSFRQLVGMKSDMNKILMRFVGAEGRARTCGRLTLQKIANQPTATNADRLIILVPIRSTVVSIDILALPIGS